MNMLIIAKAYEELGKTKIAPPLTNEIALALFRAMDNLKIILEQRP